MEKNEIYEMVIRELTEEALSEQRKNSSEEEKQLYKEVADLSVQREAIMERLSAEERHVLENYFVKTSTIADHECLYLYRQGAKDCVEFLKKLGVI